MKNIKLIQGARLEGYDGAFYRYTTANGKPSAKGIFNKWYEADAIDDNENEYRVVWEIADYEAFDNGDEDCCDWDHPSEIYSYTDGKSIEANIIW